MSVTNNKCFLLSWRVWFNFRAFRITAGNLIQLTWFRTVCSGIRRVKGAIRDVSPRE